MAQFLNFKGDYKGLSEKKASDNLNMYGNNIFTETEDKSFKSYHYLLDPTAVLLLISGLLQIFTLSQYVTGIMCIIMAIAQTVTLCVICQKNNENIRNRTLSAKMKYRVVRDEILQLIPLSLIHI